MIDFDATVLAAAEAAFAEMVLWVPADYPAAQVAGIFFDGAIEEKWQDGVAVVERATRLNARRGAFPRAPVQGDVFQVRGRSYAVSDARDDGVGGVSLLLRLATDTDATHAQLAPVPAQPG